MAGLTYIPHALFRPRPGRYGVKAATLSVQVGAPTFTDNGTKVYRIPTPYRKCRFVRGTASVTQVPLSNGGTVLGYFKKYDASSDHLEAHGTLAISATAEKFKTTTTAAWQYNGTRGTKAATDNLTFTAGHVITASKFGIILVQISSAGTISTKVPSATQAYNSAALALAALPSPDTGNFKLGHIAIENNAGDWTANTDDLTDGSDVTTAAFVDNSADTIQAVALTGSGSLEAAGMTTREVSKWECTASEADALLAAKDCLEFHVVCSSTMDTQATDLSIQAEVLVLE